MKNTSILSHRNLEPESGVLYIVATPIGNLEDLSSRALNIFSNVSLIACEDTRHTKKIMNKFKINNNLISFNKNNSYKKIPKIIEDLKKGKSVALVSDAGMPGVCDPGEDLVLSAKKNNLDIICIPGPCAAITALVSSGFPSSKFIFEGFLPRKRLEREKILLEISKNEKTTILFESPHRLKKLLMELKAFCGGTRQIEVARELTKRFEEHVGTNIDSVIDFFKEKEVVGEITLVIKGFEKSTHQSLDKSLLRSELKNLINAGLSLSAASKYLAKKNNIPKSQIYNLY